MVGAKRLRITECIKAARTAPEPPPSNMRPPRGEVSLLWAISAPGNNVSRPNHSVLPAVLNVCGQEPFETLAERLSVSESFASASFLPWNAGPTDSGDYSYDPLHRT